MRFLRRRKQDTPPAPMPTAAERQAAELAARRARRQREIEARRAAARIALAEAERERAAQELRRRLESAEEIRAACETYGWWFPGDVYPRPPHHWRNPVTAFIERIREQFSSRL